MIEKPTRSHLKLDPEPDPSRLENESEPYADWWRLATGPEGPEYSTKITRETSEARAPSSTSTSTSEVPKKRASVPRQRP